MPIQKSDSQGGQGGTGDSPVQTPQANRLRHPTWAMAAAMAVSCLRAQVPIDHRPTVPAAIPDSVSIEANIPYDQYKETVLDILQPNAPSKEKRPGVILIHGGGWVNGTKEQRVEY